ncbi:UNVERIFIED_CONTAM: hypothetical protein K2H54_004366 [Gekko kuhli]
MVFFLVWNRAIQRSLAIIRQAKQKKEKKKEYCMYYNRFGKCNRGENCPYIHDPEKVAVCTRFLRGTCKKTDGTCPFSHKVSKDKPSIPIHLAQPTCAVSPHEGLGKLQKGLPDPRAESLCPKGPACCWEARASESGAFRSLHVNIRPGLRMKMPVCSYFLKGICSNSDCPYSHVYVSRKAEVCPDFLKGYCPLGEKPGGVPPVAMARLSAGPAVSPRGGGSKAWTLPSLLGRMPRAGAVWLSSASGRWLQCRPHHGRHSSVPGPVLWLDLGSSLLLRRQTVTRGCLLTAGTPLSLCMPSGLASVRESLGFLLVSAGLEGCQGAVGGVPGPPDRDTGPAS